MVETIKQTLRDSKGARWAALLLVALTMMAAYFFTDVISPIEGVLMRTLQWSGSEYGSVVGNYSIFNIVGFLFIGGLILDKLGIRYTGTLFTSLMVVGAALKAYAVSDYFNAGGVGYEFLSSFLQGYTPSAKLALAGFAIFGLGAEMSGVTVTRIIVKWFQGKEMALAMGVQVALARLGTGAAFLLSSRLAGAGTAAESAFTPVLFGLGFLCIGFLCFMVYCMMDTKLDKQQVAVEGEKEEPFKVKDALKLLTNRGFLYIALLCVLFYSCVFPFLKFAASVMANKFHVDSVAAGDIVFFMPFGTIFFTPLFGWLVDKKGRGASLMILGAILLIVAHLIFIYSPREVVFAYIGIFVLGVAFSLVPAAMWPSVPKVCPNNLLGSGYSMIFWIQNIGLWAFPMLIAKVREATNPGVTAQIQDGIKNVYYDYTQTELMLVGVGVVAVLFAVLLKLRDKKMNYGLEVPNIQK